MCALSNIELARSILEHEPEDFRELCDHLHEDATFRCTAPSGTPVSGEFRGRKEIEQYFTVTSKQIVANVRATKPVEYFENGGRVVALTEETYEIRKNCVTTCRDTAIVIDFKDGLITSLLVIQDLSDLAEAYRED